MSVIELKAGFDPALAKDVGRKVREEFLGKVFSFLIMQIKTTRYHITPVRMAIVKKDNK